MLRVAARLRRDHPRARLLLQVHDELIVEAPQAEAEAVCRAVQEEMEQAASLRVPLIAEAKLGRSWYEAK